MPLTFPKCDVLCLARRPKGGQWEQLIKWLGCFPARKVVIFDPSETVAHPQVVLCERDPGAIQRLAKEHAFLRFDCLEQDGEDRALFALVEEMVEWAALSASDVRERGIDRLHNLLKNCRYLDKAYRADQFFGHFSGIPAIVCGAGPSLDRHIPQLGGPLQKRALLFAGGAALSRLTQFGVRPHFSGVIDPHPPREVDQRHTACETPCFFQLRAHPQKLDAFGGPLLWTPGSEQDFFEEERFEGGWNVSTFLTAIAAHLGCNPVILVGVDLCGKGHQLYSGEGGETGGWIRLPSGVQTKRDWLLAAGFLSRLAQGRPELTWINTSVGIALDGFVHQRLEEVDLDLERDLNGVVHASMAQGESGVHWPYSAEEIRTSLGRVGSLCEQLIALVAKGCARGSQRGAERVILEVELRREEAYSHFIGPIWEVWQPLLARNLTGELAQSGLCAELGQWLFIKGICDDARHI